MRLVVRRAFLAMAVVIALGGSAASGGIAQEVVDAPHPSHIPPGACAELDPNPLYPLADVEPVSADAGLGSVEVGETSVDVSLDDLVASPFAINIHESVENVANYVACGDVVGVVVDDSLVIGLRGQNDSGYSGIAVLTGNGASTDISVYLGFGIAGASDSATPVAASPPMDAEVEVAIFDYGFDDETIEITVGTTVTWTNVGQVIHTATENGTLWDSEILDTGESFSYTFEEAGTFEYLCSLHPSMVAIVVVTDG